MRKEYPPYFGLYCCCCMVIIMKANNRVTQEELTKAVSEVKRRKNLELKDVQALLHFTDHYPDIVEDIFIKSSKDLDEKDKKYGIKLALEMALADNSFEASEKVKLKGLIEKAGLPHEYYNELISGNS